MSSRYSQGSSNDAAGPPPDVLQPTTQASGPGNQNKIKLVSASNTDPVMDFCHTGPTTQQVWGGSTATASFGLPMPGSSHLESNYSGRAASNSGDVSNLETPGTRSADHRRQQEEELVEADEADSTLRQPNRYLLNELKKDPDWEESSLTCSIQRSRTTKVRHLWLITVEIQNREKLGKKKLNLAEMHELWLPNEFDTRDNTRAMNSRTKSDRDASYWATVAKGIMLAVRGACADSNETLLTDGRIRSARSDRQRRFGACLYAPRYAHSEGSSGHIQIEKLQFGYASIIRPTYRPSHHKSALEFWQVLDNWRLNGRDDTWKDGESMKQLIESQRR